MLKSLLGLVGLGGPEYDAKILARDARSMIDMVHGQHGAASLESITATCREHINLVHERGLNDPQFYEQGIVQLTELNKAARMRRENAVWSGITLAVIYVRAEILGDLGMPAKNVIEGFMQKWEHDGNLGDEYEGTDIY